MGWEIPFNRPGLVGNELSYLERAARGAGPLGGGSFTAAASDLLREATGAHEALLTTSCTSALELAALLLDLEPGDSVIVPSFTFVTTALAFVRAGAVLRFADIDPVTLGLDPASVAALVDDSVRAVVPVHYAGVACDLDGLATALPPEVPLVVDNAHGPFGEHEGRPLGSSGRFVAQSFHHTKTFSCGEGGALLCNDPGDVERARIVYEKGTNRRAYLDGTVDRYRWVDVGSSFALSELLAAHLLGQFEQRDRVLSRRREIAERYDRLLRPFEEQLGFRVPARPLSDHVWYLLLDDPERREPLIRELAAVGIGAASHYVPLHDSVGARPHLDPRVARPECPVTDSVASRILRLPSYHDLTGPEVDRVCEELVKLLSR